MGFQPLEQCVGIKRDRPTRDQFIELFLVFSSGDMVCVIGMFCHRRIAHGFGETLKHRILIGTHHNGVSIGTGIDIGRRGFRQYGTTPFSNLTTFCVFGDR